MFRPLALLGLAAACSSQPAPDAVATKAPLSEQELARIQAVRERMWTLAQHVRDLDSHIRTSQPPDATRVIGLLDAVAVTAEGVAELKAPKTHPLLRGDLNRFLAEIASARAAATAEPPRLLMAANISGACIYCHALETCPFDAYDKCLDVPIY